MAAEDTGEFGPAMRRLSHKQQQFVIAVVDMPAIKAWKAAEIAGFGGSRGGSAAGRKHVLQQIGWKLSHDQRIIEAMHEETAKRMRLGGMLGVRNLIQMAMNPEHRDYYKASLALAEREFGGVAQRVDLEVTHTDLTGAAMVERIKQLAGILGLDERKLLGARATPEPVKVIEHDG